MAAAMDLDGPPQVKVVFTTSDPSLELPEPKRQLLVPADIQRHGLSRILNSESMLSTPRPVPLDFLLDGAFLRASLHDALVAAGTSLESTVALQYVRSLIPPVFEASFPHEDWVSCVDLLSAASPAARWAGDGDDGNGEVGGLVRERILSASYDGLVRVWDGSGSVLATSPGLRGGGHGRRLNAARWISPRSVASAGLDGKIVVWDYKEQEDGLEGKFTPKMELFGHAKMITNLAVNGSTKRILTSCADGTIGIWSASKRTAPAADPAALPSAFTHKRAKLSSSTTSAQRGPLAILPVHADAATATIFHPADSTVAYSVSHAHTLCTIDLPTQRVISTLTTAHPLLCLAALPPSRGLLAAGTSARHVTLVDPREGTASISAMTLRGHSNMVSDVAAAPADDFSLVSASHDGTCKVWDIRSVRPGSREDAGGPVGEAAYTIGREGHGKKMAAAGDGVKVLSVAWDKEWGIVSGGEDKTVQVNRGRDIMS